MNSFRKKKLRLPTLRFVEISMGKKTMPNLRRRVRKQGSIDRLPFSDLTPVDPWPCWAPSLQCQTSAGGFGSPGGTRIRDGENFGRSSEVPQKENNQMVGWKLEVENSNFKYIMVLKKFTFFLKKLWLKVEHFFTFLITNRERSSPNLNLIHS